MGSSNDNLSNEEKFIIDFRIRHQWNIRTKTQLLFKRFIWAILTNWWISDKAGPFWRQLPTPANALRPTYINHSSPKVFTSKCPLIFLHLFLLLLSRVSNHIAFTVNLFCVSPIIYMIQSCPWTQPYLKTFHRSNCFLIFPTSVKKIALILNTLTFGNIINLPQQYSDIDPP